MTGQGKLPLEVVTDNNLLRKRYENGELGGAKLLYVMDSASGVEITGITASTAAPNNADGQPDGTIYIQVT